MAGKTRWVANFPEALATSMRGLPRIIGVPAYLDMELEPFILETLHHFGADSVTTKRVWERNRPSLKPQRYTEPTLAVTLFRKRLCWTCGATLALK